MVFPRGVPWDRCPEHENPFPVGARCPRCEKEHKLRQERATFLKWKEIIPVSYQRDFMLCEHVYCRDEEQAFYACKEKHVDKKDKLRTAVLEKREEFLLWYVKAVLKEELENVYQPKSGNR